MRDIPIIFSASMVRALLEGRKTMTRRLAWRDYQPRPDDGAKPVPADVYALPGRIGGVRPSPWQKVQPGDRLWVRETCQAVEAHDGLDCVRYPADQRWEPIEDSQEAADRWIDLHHYRKQRGQLVPPIHAPRWASRLTLEVTATKIERLQDISEEDATAEGIQRFRLNVVPTRIPAPGEYFPSTAVVYASEWPTHPELVGDSPRAGYRFLWQRLHGEESWDANPEVVALTFKVHQVNIDRMQEAA